MAEAERDLKNLTPEEWAAVEAFEDADAPREEVHFDWGEDYQRSVLAMLMADRNFLMKSVGLVKADYFTNKAHKKVADVLFSHFREYGRTPTRPIFVKEMSDRFKDDESRLFYLAELQMLYDGYEEGVESREYHEREIFNFAKMVALKKAFHRSMEELKKSPGDETWVKIDKWLEEARIVDLGFDPGLDYFGQVMSRYAAMRQSRESVEVFTTGFKTLDDEMTFGGMRRGEVYSFMGPPGVGKSLCLVKASVDNVRAGKRVLYISLEMNETDIAARFDAQFAGVDIRCLIDNEPTVSRALCDLVSQHDDKRLLVVKQFASGTADVNTIRAYVEQLDMVGIRPDMVVVDYVGEMKDLVGIPLYESREKMVKDLRGFAVEKDVCLLTAMQPNRAAREAMKDGGVIADDNLGDSYGQLRPLDGLVTINQTDIEKRVGVARLYVAKMRSGKSRFTFFVSVDPLTLQFSEIGENRYRVTMSKATQEAAGNVRVDEIKTDMAVESIVGRWRPEDHRQHERG